MITFKQYITEIKKANSEYIVNAHGSHHKQLKEFIINSHGSHATRINEALEKSFSDYAKKNFNPGLGKSPAEHMTKLNAVHPLSNTDANHLTKWSSGSSTLTHAMLDAHRKGNPITSGAHWGHDVQGLDRATTNPLRVGAVVHSGIAFNPAKADSHMVSHISASTDPNVAHTFATKYAQVDENTGDTVHRMLRIHLKKGDPAAVIGEAKHPVTGKPISEYDNEHEVLVGRTLATGKKLKINPTPEVYRDDKQRLIHVHHAELSDDE